MGLYLCVFDEDEELEGVEVGSYDDFGFFRDSIREKLEGGRAGSRFPILMLHSDCDGEWSSEESLALMRELESISESFLSLPAVEARSDWQRQVISTLGVKPRSLYESFIDVDGEPLLGRLIGLCRIAGEEGKPILFQ